MIFSHVKKKRKKEKKKNNKETNPVYTTAGNYKRRNAKVRELPQGDHTALG